MTIQPGSPVDRLLTASLIFAPMLYLLADCLYAARGWDDGAAGLTHVLGATAYAFVFLRLVTLSDRVMAAVLLVVAVLGTAGNVGYGFNTIHVSLGDTDLVDASGAAVLIKPLGLFFPLAILLAAWALHRIAAPWLTVTLALSAIAWPVAHIPDIAWLAVAVNVALVAAFGALAIRVPQPAHSRPTNPRDVRATTHRPA